MFWDLGIMFVVRFCSKKYFGRRHCIHSSPFTITSQIFSTSVIPPRSRSSPNFRDPPHVRGPPPNFRDPPQLPWSSPTSVILPNFRDPPQLLWSSPTSVILPNFRDLSFDHEVCVCGVSLVNGNVWSIFPKTSLTVYNSKIVN
jgi:hypothetical protein